MELRKNSEYTVTVEGYSSQGLGVARVDGQVVFVHGALRGERCRIQILKALQNSAYARVTQLLEPSPQRRQPACPYFGRCGGCAYWHMSYEEELRAKRRRVDDALERLGGTPVRCAAILGAESCLAYRNKSQYPISAAGEIGFYRARSHQVVPVEHCLIQKPEANAAAAAVKQWMARWQVPGYDERSGEGLLRHLYVRSNSRGESLVCLLVNGTALPREKELVACLREACPGTVGILLGCNRRRDNVILGESYRCLWGQDTLEDSLCGLTFRLSVPSFYQVNHRQAQLLYDKAVELAGLSGRETVLDLYCGTGTITLAMARQARLAIGAEIVPQAVEDARENARRNGLSRRAEFFCGDASQLAARLAQQRLTPDVVCVDPPRKGLAQEGIDAIVRLNPARVVYISCDPGTLGRDVKLFARQGYILQQALAVDMFPRTVHVECCVLLCREDRK